MSESGRTSLCLSIHFCFFLSQTSPGAHVVRSVLLTRGAFFSGAAPPLAPPAAPLAPVPPLSSPPAARAAGAANPKPIKRTPQKSVDARPRQLLGEDLTEANMIGSFRWR